MAEEAGRAAFASPLIATLNSTLVLKQCGTTSADTILGEIAAGKPVSLAITGQSGSWVPGTTDVELRSNTLHGVAWYVQDAGKADGFVVSARSANGVGLYYVDAAATGVCIHPDGIIDLTRDQARVEFIGADAIELAAPGAGKRALERAFPSMLAVVSADMVGAGDWLLQTTVEYANTRVQFDRPLGFFQAVKHPLVNVMIDIDRAKSLTYATACAIDSDPDFTEPDTIINTAHMAKACASEMAVFASSRAVQFHGGIGFTWQCYVHLFFKRQMHNQMLYGDAAYHRAELADRLIGEAA